MSKNFKFKVQGGGVFSRILQCAIIPLTDIDFDNVYLSLTSLDIEHLTDSDPHIKHFKDSFKHQIKTLSEFGMEANHVPLNYVLEQNFDDSYVDGGNLPVGRFHSDKNPIEMSPRICEYKETVKKLRIKPALGSQADAIFSGIDLNEVLGVHLRLKDVSGHGYDKVTFDMYVEAINSMLEKNNFTKIFVAADNHVSIQKLQSIYGTDAILTSNAQRSDSDKSDFAKWEFEHFFKKHYWWDAFVDCLALAKTPYLVCRNSNFSNAAILFGNHREIKRIS